MKIIKYGLYILALYIVLARPTLSTFDKELNHIPPQHVNAFVGTSTKLRMNGIDVSHYQGAIDFKSVEDAGIKFVYVKATEGMDYVDPRYHENIEKLLNTKLLTGAYHYFQPGDDVIEQANNFINHVNNSHHSLPPMLDVEISGGLNSDELKARVAQWLGYVEKKTNCRPIIFSYGDFWKEYLGKEFNKYTFWLADYTKKPSRPAGLGNWRIWQYTDTGNISGIGGNVDHDVIIKGNVGCYD